MAEKELRRKCYFCDVVGEAGKDVFWADDPYLADVQGKFVKRWMHKHCEEEQARDI